MSGDPGSSSRYGDPDVVWSTRDYRATRAPHVGEHEGERGVALPGRPSPWWVQLGLVLILLVLLAFLAVTVVITARGQSRDLVASVVAVLVLGLLVAGVVRRVRRRLPDVVVTPTRIVTARGQEVDWAEVESIAAVQRMEQRTPRPIDTAVAVVGGREVELFQAWLLGCDPRSALAGLRRLHQDPELRSQLGTDSGPELF